MRKSRLAPGAVSNGVFVSSVCSVCCVQRAPRPWYPPGRGVSLFEARTEQHQSNDGRALGGGSGATGITTSRDSARAQDEKHRKPQHWYASMLSCRTRRRARERGPSRARLWPAA